MRLCILYVFYNFHFLLILFYSVSRSVMSNFLQPHGLQPARLLCPCDSPGKNTGVGCHSLLQGIFPTQGWNPGLLHCRQILYHPSYREDPIPFYGIYKCVSRNRKSRVTGAALPINGHRLTCWWGQVVWWTQAAQAGQQETSTHSPAREAQWDQPTLTALGGCSLGTSRPSVP